MSVYASTNVNVSSPHYAEIFNPGDEQVQSVIHSSQSPFLSDHSSPLWLWVLTDGGLYFGDDAMMIAPELINPITGYSLLRHVVGVADGEGIAAWKSEDSTPSTYDDGFTSGLGTKSFFNSSSLPFGTWTPTTQEGVWSASGGRTDAGCLIGTDTGVFDSGSYKVNITIVIDLGIETTMNGASWWMKCDQNGHAWGWRLSYYNEAKENVATLVNTFDFGSSTTYTEKSFSSSANGVRYIGISIGVGLPDNIWLDDISIDYEGGVVKVAFSDDLGETMTETVVGGIGGTGFDSDDFNQNILISAANNGLYFATLYGGGYTYLAGLTGIDGITPVSCVRIPYLTHDNIFNDDVTALEFVYGTASAVGGATLWRVVFDSTDGTITSQTNITPILSSTTYAVVGAEALEASGDNSGRIFAAVQPDGGGTKALIRSFNGGVAWSMINPNLNLSFVRWQVGNTRVCAFAGVDGLKLTKTSGSAILDRLGDFPEDTATGFYVFPW